MAKLNIADIRQEYTKGGLRESELPGDPLSLFSRWLQEAIDAEVDEPTAVIVGTVSPEGRPVCCSRQPGCDRKTARQ